MWFWVIFLAIGGVFVWSWLQQNPDKIRFDSRKPGKPAEKERPTPSPRAKKKPFFRIERVEDD